MKAIVFLALLAGLLAGCKTTPAQQTAVIGAVTTLAGVATATNTQVASIVSKGALFCSKVESGVPMVVALATLAGAPVSVIGMAASDVSEACAVVDMIPVPPPANPAAVTVMPTATTLPTV